jgi:hypothetical protein
MDALPRGTAQIVTATPGPALPLLHHVEGNEYPIYTGPLGVARLFVRRDRHLVEVCKYGMKWGAFLADDPEAEQVNEFSVSYVSAEAALREVLGVYFTLAGYDSTTLAADLRRLIVNELDHLNQPEGATT